MKLIVITIRVLSSIRFFEIKYKNERFLSFYCSVLPWRIYDYKIEGVHSNCKEMLNFTYTFLNYFWLVDQDLKHLREETRNLEELEIIN